ncbi:MAG TPA: hypothetical protein VFT87_02080 [Candidatus Saccharimonadales bacterium]|nr:hypothetical protein [Candidatus Saccharimonadales bacterium]
MKTYILYRPISEHATKVEEYLRDFKAQTGKDIPMLDVDSPEGAEVCTLYDIVQYPAILATDNEGRVQNIWVGDNLPTISEVSYYVGDERI